MAIVIITSEFIKSESKRASWMCMGQVPGQMNSMCGGAPTEPKLVQWNSIPDLVGIMWSLYLSTSGCLEGLGVWTTELSYFLPNLGWDSESFTLLPPHVLSCYKHRYCYPWSQSSRVLCQGTAICLSLKSPVTQAANPLYFQTVSPSKSWGLSHKGTEQ